MIGCRGGKKEPTAEKYWRATEELHRSSQETTLFGFFAADESILKRTSRLCYRRFPDRLGSLSVQVAT